MVAFELVCIAIVLLYIALRVRRCEQWSQRASFAIRFFTLMVASFIGEDSIIHAYEFYGYAPGWHAFIDRVPLLIVCIWPVVIDSAWQLARAIVDRDDAEAWKKIAIVTGAIVLADASLIEPISVACGLWSWSEPGIFHVPLIGIVGWSIFTAVAVAIGERWKDAATKRIAITITLAPIATHAILIAMWWGAFRYARGEFTASIVVAIAWSIFACIAILLWRTRIRDRVPFADLALRAPGAATFFALLAITPATRTMPLLVVYSLAFVPPYVALFRTRSSESKAPPPRSTKEPRPA